LSALSSLAAALGVPAEEVGYLEGYDDTKLDRLRVLVETAVATESASTEQALLDGLVHVPRPLRGAAKGLLFPGAKS